MADRKGMAALALALAASGGAGCTVGEGTGEIWSDRLFVEDCWNGPFDLDPTFFGANPFRREEIVFRIQRGDDVQELSDGLTIHVRDIQTIRGEEIGDPIEVGLPPGVSPPGVPITYDPTPPRVSLALYLHDSCHSQNAAVYAVSGTITFESLFSGNPNESDADDRLTEAQFEALFVDPRNLNPDGTAEPGVSSVVRGTFRFFFQRGQPAQPFP